MQFLVKSGDTEASAHLWFTYISDLSYTWIGSKSPTTTSIQDLHSPQGWFVKAMSYCNCANRKRLLYRQLQQRQPHHFPCFELLPPAKRTSSGSNIVSIR